MEINTFENMSAGLQSVRGEIACGGAARLQPVWLRRCAPLAGTLVAAIGDEHFREHLSRPQKRRIVREPDG
uniref:Uncharacterized protein n=1 Tax=mine drainage metagenome TaxID=410659 RepID=E6PU11_9ZZZZ